MSHYDPDAHARTDKGSIRDSLQEVYRLRTRFFERVAETLPTCHRQLVTSDAVQHAVAMQCADEGEWNDHYLWLEAHVGEWQRAYELIERQPEDDPTFDPCIPDSWIRETGTRTIETYAANPAMSNERPKFDVPLRALFDHRFNNAGLRSSTADALIERSRVVIEFNPYEESATEVIARLKTSYQQAVRAAMDREKSVVSIRFSATEDRDLGWLARCVLLPDSGHSQRKIAVETGCHQSTVNKAVNTMAKRIGLYFDHSIEPWYPGRGV